MISDLMDETCQRLEWYQQNCPDAYLRDQLALDNLRVLMEAVQLYYDASPGLRPLAEITRRELMREIASLPLGEVRRLMQLFRHMLNPPPPATGG